MSKRFVAYRPSLAPYFNDSSQVNPGLLKRKAMELLYNVMACSKDSRNTAEFHALERSY